MHYYRSLAGTTMEVPSLVGDTGAGSIEPGEIFGADVKLDDVFDWVEPAAAGDKPVEDGPPRTYRSVHAVQHGEHVEPSAGGAEAQVAPIPPTADPPAKTTSGKRAGVSKEA